MARAPRGWTGPTQVAAVLVAIVLAGCSSAGPPDSAQDGDEAPWPVVQAPPFDFTTAIEEVHDHSAAAEHTLGYGMERVGWDPLSSASEPGVLPGSHTEVSVVADAEGASWAFIANFGPSRAFSIVDVTDPSAPQHVSDFLPDLPATALHPGGGSYWDVAAFPGGDLVVSSAQARAAAAGAADASALDETGGGILLVNTSDKGSPFLESFTQVIDTDAQVPVGIHNARPFFAQGRPHVAATTANGDTVLYEVVGEPGARTLEMRSRVLGTHDTTVQVHPLTNQTLLYGAQGGVHITDISDPSSPELIASVPNGPELSAYHIIVPSDVLVEGRHFIVSGTETTTGTPPFLTIIDTTEPASPFIVGTWQAPFDDELYMPGPYRWSTHNFDVDRGRIILGHYHAGVWIIDVSSLHNLQEPVTLAFYQPHETPLYVPRSPLGADVPAVWGAVQHTDGLVYASDINTGLYILEFQGEPSPLQNATVYPHNQR